ncbi:MAG: tRNA dihydrouridine(20/20a) synthase DusA [gamma proteobacterium symbiont of Bathyaustriella thionipta]|nr:tRNA dihydrouridine(20/20a) synthase DusA [gamma proteobacterium symbiont of Bathyaustriella thionipta]MCU7949714.1 tRNA dihydrouridine(20/20a) synthase DusA [gamma proteobacterium symbiont of Bathyaustriella thionipta]MCU7952916.1 tRNA dihydrouridine(20/20a) synthase DusA [gamma proteobacterium symbiont of Bathyaustriella thionipta]MCU7956424.1 tRNA dihydrouridine(20/20a) synthase DusA [gamma proteobacterium symbiont of Bathyaustriella thionipta]MCU7967533.1 tRNA dihydrouridine(20/20a) synt
MPDIACQQINTRKVSLAPMLDWTDKHFRYLLRLVSKNIWLYTEMVTTGAILHGDNLPRFLAYNNEEHPLTLQLGGSDPVDLAKCCQLAEEYGYDEVNLNVGCPSDRVQSGAFGACLMAKPDLVAECIGAMVDSVNIPISIKTRIGIDHEDHYEQLQTLVETVSQTGCRYFTIHARKAWLEGLSPKQNRDVPPLRYEFVYQLKKDFPDLHITINGGIKSLVEMQAHLKQVDGVMIGREAYHNTYLMADIDQLFYDSTQIKCTRKEIINAYADYVEQEMTKGVPMIHLTRHVLGLMHSCQGAKNFRRVLSENAWKKEQGPQLLIKAATEVDCD